MAHFRKLIDLLEQDALQFNKTTEDEMLDAYRSILDKEIDEVSEIMQAFIRLV